MIALIVIIENILLSLEEDIDLESDICDDIKEFGFFSSKNEAKKCVHKLKNKKIRKKILLQREILNQIYWDGGFFTDYLYDRFREYDPFIGQMDGKRPYAICWW